MELYVLTADLVFATMVVLTTPGILFYAANASILASNIIRTMGK